MMREQEINEKVRGSGIVRLSPRLMTVADFVEKGSRIADIGTDHGYIPIFLAQTGRIRSALAMDVKKGPLERAAVHVEEYERRAALEGRKPIPIETRLGDGLKELRPGEADTVMIAGMGGGLEIRILEQGRSLWDGLKHFILSPQSDLDKVRRYLFENGFRIQDEAMVKDEDKYYTVISAVRGDMEEYTLSQYKYGKLLIQKRDCVLREFLDRETDRVRGIIESLESREKSSVTDRQARALAGLREELSWIEEAQDEMQ